MACTAAKGGAVSPGRSVVRPSSASSWLASPSPVTRLELLLFEAALALAAADLAARGLGEGAALDEVRLGDRQPELGADGGDDGGGEAGGELARLGDDDGDLGPAVVEAGEGDALAVADPVDTGDDALDVLRVVVLAVEDE